MDEDKKKITAAILTLSESIEGLFKIMRKDLQFRVEQDQTKIVEDFLPRRMRPTTERFKEFEKLLTELETAVINPLQETEPVKQETGPKIEKAYFDDDSEKYPSPIHKLRRSEENPPEEYTLNDGELPEDE